MIYLRCFSFCLFWFSFCFCYFVCLGLGGLGYGALPAPHQPNPTLFLFFGGRGLAGCRLFGRLGFGRFRLFGFWKAWVGVHIARTLPLFVLFGGIVLSFCGGWLFEVPKANLPKQDNTTEGHKINLGFQHFWHFERECLAKGKRNRDRPEPGKTKTNFIQNSFFVYHLSLLVLHFCVFPCFLFFLSCFEFWEPAGYVQSPETSHHNQNRVMKK